MRSQLINWLNSNQIPIQENIWTPDFVSKLEAIAYSNCLVEVIPIHTVINQSQNLSYSSFSAIEQLQNYFKIKIP